MTLTVPGNVLLLGEYAVLEEGGLGLAMAVERRVRIRTSAGSGLSVGGSWPGGSFEWTPRDPGSHRLMAAAVESAQGWLAENGRPAPDWSARIAADSTDLFRPDGRKRGLGASAAVCVGLVAALLFEAGRNDGQAQQAVPSIATRAHRAAQGGRGSGYDVLCSFHGAMGLFRGGANPSWEPCRLPWDAAVFLFPGPASVSTVDAVQRYAAWKDRNRRAAGEFREDSNRCVREFIRAPSAGEAVLRLDDCRRLGVAIGDAIGVPARIAAPRGLDAASCKALGAGDELGACIIDAARAPEAEASGHERACLSERGMAWEE